MKTLVVVASAVLENSTIFQIMDLLKYFDNARDDDGRLLDRDAAILFCQTRGYISVWAEISTTMTPLGPTLRLRNKPADIELTVPWSLVHYIVRIPDEGNQLSGVGFKPGS